MKPFLLLDLFLMNRVFIPLAWWIDWRWHRSPYQMALAFIMLAQLVNGVGTVWMLVGHKPWLGLLMGAISIFLHFTIFKYHRHQLRECQKQFERRPDMLCIEQLVYMHIAGAFIRVAQLVFGMMLTLMFAVADLAAGHLPDVALFNSWVLFVGVALYFAGTCPPLRPRREKKEQAWGRLLTSPTPA